MTHIQNNETITPLPAARDPNADEGNYIRLSIDVYADEDFDMVAMLAHVLQRLSGTAFPGLTKNSAIRLGYTNFSEDSYQATRRRAGFLTLQAFESDAYVAKIIKFFVEHDGGVTSDGKRFNFLLFSADHVETFNGFICARRLN